MIGYFRVIFIATTLVGVRAHAQSEPLQPVREPEEERTQDELAKKLMRDTVEQPGSTDLMDEMIRSMAEIAHKLQIKFDPGEQTQTQQREVANMLDRAIKEAASRRKAQPQSEQKQMADKRSMPAPRKAQPKPEDKNQPGDGHAKTAASEKNAGDQAASAENDKALPPGARRGWGNLPQRDREEFLQGADEEYLERFRPWIEQYYKALQESNR